MYTLTGRIATNTCPMKNVIEESNPGAHMVFELPHREECSINREFCDYYVLDCPFPDCCHVCIS